ncbi:MAG TPA: ectoine/hydroxyectoine ABC transporter ATP-binding protein EhuA [Anaerolineae bacterium]|nr:ectoine/hydroxyectoine ABC transporter ATP-binding protein EhuA [Anaerolineae bacterium]
MQSDTNKQTEPIIRFQQVNKSFGQLHVLRDLDLHVSPGEKVCLIGPSGSGKTTILRILMTLEKPNSGLVWVDGELLWHKEARGKRVPADEKHLRHMRTKIGMVFQQFNLFPHMKVLRNVTEAPIHVLGTPPEQAEARALQLLDMVGLSSKIDCYPMQLSGGQQQRVAIARALAMQPKIMLFDEITAALDPELVAEVLIVLQNLAHETDMTMLIVTHEMWFAMDVADRVLFFENGQIVEEGPPEVVLANPTNPRTRSFLRAVLPQGARDAEIADLTACE